MKDENDNVEKKSKSKSKKVASPEDSKSEDSKIDGEDTKKLFFSIFEKNRVVITQTNSGAGFLGLIGFVGLFLVSSVFFITENYFISMFTISIGLLVYVSGHNIARLLLSSFTIFFSSRHLDTRAANMQATLTHLKLALGLRRGPKGIIVEGPIAPGKAISLPDNPFTRELQSVVENKRDFTYAEYIAHSFYLGCHELYDSANSNYDFVSNTMPLFGLIGTIVGLIAMFDSLGADVTVESLSPQLALALKTTLYGAIFSSIYKIIATRFELRLKMLDYDYETVCRALQLVVENKHPIEVK